MVMMMRRRKKKEENNRSYNDEDDLYEDYSQDKNTSHYSNNLHRNRNCILLTLAQVCFYIDTAERRLPQQGVSSCAAGSSKHSASC